MALATYTDLQAAVIAWLHRDDLAAVVPDFIALAESRMNRALRVRQQVTTTTLSTVAGTATVALPASWLEFESLRLVTPNWQVEHLPRGQFVDAHPTSDTGAPTHYVIDGSNIVLGPKPDAVYSIEAVYFAAVPALSGGNPTNWLLTAWPNLYLFAALSESAPFIGQDERVQVWEAKYAVELQAAITADARARSSGSALRIRAR